MVPGKFFDERNDQSEVKTRVVQKYFHAWARTIIPTARSSGAKIAYIDLYAGPGRYKDGAMSTPLLVLERASADPDMSQMLVALFNDAERRAGADREEAFGPFALMCRSLLVADAQAQ